MKYLERYGRFSDYYKCANTFYIKLWDMSGF